MKAKFLIISMVIAISAISQTTKTYKGKFGNGAGQYDYYENSDGERIKHGLLNYKEVVYTGTVTYSQQLNYIVSGNYKNGVNDGDWTEKFIEFQSGWTGALTHYDPTTHKQVLDGYTINNNKNIEAESTLRCHFSNGKLSGEYTSLTHKNINGKTILTMSIKANFANGILIGNYSFIAADEKIIGQFDESGYVNGVWNIKNISNTVEIHFDHGYLKKYTMKNKEGIIISKYENLRINLIEKMKQSGYIINNTPENTEHGEEDSLQRITISEFSTPPLEFRFPMGALNKTEFLKISRNEYSRNLIMTITSPYISKKNAKIKVLNDSLEHYRTLVYQTRAKNKELLEPYEKSLYDAIHDPITTSESIALIDRLRNTIDSIKSINKEREEKDIEKFNEYDQKITRFKNFPIYNHDSTFIKSWSYSDSLSKFKLTISDISLNPNEQEDSHVIGTFTLNDKIYQFDASIHINELMYGVVSIESEDFQLPENMTFSFNVFDKVTVAKIKYNKIEKDVLLFPQ